MAYIEDFNLTDLNGLEINPASEESVAILKKLLIMLAPISTQDTNQRIRITVDSITGALTLATVTTIGTVNTVTTMNQIAGVDARYMLMDNARNMYANSVRPYISF